MVQLPIGIQDFKVIRDEGMYFVDKSMIIGQMLNHNRRGVFLYTRPRRFGKSLNLSMIDAFFNLEYRGNTWFDGLAISYCPEYDVFKNAFPVISLDLRANCVKNFQQFLDVFNSQLYSIFKRFRYLMDSDRIDGTDKNLFMKLRAGEKTVTDSAKALNNLCSMLEDHHKSKVVVLIDEYDSTVNQITDPVLRGEVLDFLREMLSSLLKGNQSLQFAVVTGIMQITKENIFSGLNNLYVNNIFSSRYDEMFGFTDDEVREICIEYGHPEKYDEAREWYDGYRFGEADIYNPWSILNYVMEDFEPMPYWVNTSSNSIISDLISDADDETFENLTKLGSGKPLRTSISAEMTFRNLEADREAIYSIMAVSGYLKAVNIDDDYQVSIPNRELYSEFSRIINGAVYRNVGSAISDLNRFTRAVLSADSGMLGNSLQNLITDVLSARILDSEHAYQGFIVGLLMNLAGRYEITADREAGKGYYDIRMKRNAGHGCNVVMELKRAESEGSLETIANSALEQICERDYAHGLKGKTILYGIAFHGKVPYVVSKEIEASGE